MQFRILLVSLFLSLMSAHHWTVHSLYDHISKKSISSSVLNPNDLISYSATTKIERIINKIEAIDVKFILVDNVSPEYANQQGMIDIDYFLEQFLRKSTKNLTQFDNTLIIFYSLKDRKYKWRTGNLSRKVISDDNCGEIAESIKPYLRESKNDLAFIDLFEKLAEKLKKKEHFSTIQSNYYQDNSEENWVVVFIVFVFIFGAIILMIYCFLSKKNKHFETNTSEVKTNGKKNDEVLSELLNKNYGNLRNRLNDNNLNYGLSNQHFQYNSREEHKFYPNNLDPNQPNFTYPNLEDEFNVNEMRRSFGDNHASVEHRLHTSFQEKFRRENQKMSEPKHVFENNFELPHFSSIHNNNGNFFEQPLPNNIYNFAKTIGNNPGFDRPILQKSEVNIEQTQPILSFLNNNVQNFVERTNVNNFHVFTQTVVNNPVLNKVINYNCDEIKEPIQSKVEILRKKSPEKNIKSGTSGSWMPSFFINKKVEKNVQSNVENKINAKVEPIKPKVETIKQKSPEKKKTCGTSGDWTSFFAFDQKTETKTSSKSKKDSSFIDFFSSTSKPDDDKSKNESSGGTSGGW